MHKPYQLEALRCREIYSYIEKASWVKTRDK